MRIGESQILNSAGDGDEEGPTRAIPFPYQAAGAASRETNHILYRLELQLSQFEPMRGRSALM